MIDPPGQSEDSTIGESLAPPQPNLGPEPMDAGGSLVPAVVLLLNGLVALAALLILRRRWSKRQEAERSTPPPDDSPEARLLALRERARSLLAARFGPSLRARTTEELADDAQVAEALGADKLAQLTALLRAGDRLLFDGDSPMDASDAPPPELEAWSNLLDAIARSRLGSESKKGP